MNTIVLVGRLVADPSLRYTQTGTAVANFTLAVDRRQSKDRDKETDFIDVVVWSKLAETCAQYIGKGRLVAVSGRLQIRPYQDKEGNRRKAAEVVADSVRFLDKPKEHETRGGLVDSGIELDDGDIPF